MTIPRLVLVSALLLGCALPTPAEISPSGPASLLTPAGTEWQLHDLGRSPAPLGAGGRRATLTFSDSARVAGFAGCNRYFGSYTIDGATLRFGAIGMTRMACQEGMELEQQLARALDLTRTYQLNGNGLTLAGESGPLARFVRVAP
jgi:heat shock protein HslJ